MNLCTDCGESFADVSRHWVLSDCSPPDLTENQHEILTGLMMGDASINHRDRDRPAIRARMGNKPYLNWLHEQFKPMTTGVSEATETGGWKTTTKMYRLRWRGRPEFTEYTSWYDSGQKRFPDDLTVTPTILKHWYVCDGSLNTNGMMRLSMKNESDRKGFIEHLFESQGFEIGRWDTHEHRCAAVFHAHVRDQLFDWMGEAPPGFEYKWPDGEAL
jgi:hypothetical protein